MWQYYRKTFIPTQILMIVLCIALMAVWKVPGRAVVVYLVIMELFGFFGAMWGARLRRRIIRSQGSLPDDRQ